MENIDEIVLENCKTRIKELENALHKTYIKLIQVCPGSLAGEKELCDVMDIAEKALNEVK